MLKSVTWWYRSAMLFQKKYYLLRWPITSNRHQGTSENNSDNCVSAKKLLWTNQKDLIRWTASFIFCTCVGENNSPYHQPYLHPNPKSLSNSIDPSSCCYYKATFFETNLPNIALPIKNMSKKKLVNGTDKQADVEKKEKPHKMGEIMPAALRDSYYFFRFWKQVKLKSQSEGILSEMGFTADSTCSISQKAAEEPRADWCGIHRNYSDHRRSGPVARW